MVILVSGGEKTNNIVVGLERKFAHTGVEFLTVKNIEDIDEIYGKGQYFDRALIAEQSWTHDGAIKDEKEIRKKICSFSVNASIHNDMGTGYVLLSLSNEMAEIVHEEILSIRESSAVVVKKPPYSVGFFSGLVTTDIEKIDKSIVFKPVTEVDVEETDIFGETNSKDEDNYELEDGLIDDTDDIEEDTESTEDNTEEETYTVDDSVIDDVISETKGLVKETDELLEKADEELDTVDEIEEGLDDEPEETEEEPEKKGVELEEEDILLEVDEEYYRSIENKKEDNNEYDEADEDDEADEADEELLGEDEELVEEEEQIGEEQIGEEQVGEEQVGEDDELLEYDEEQIEDNIGKGVYEEGETQEEDQYSDEDVAEYEEYESEQEKYYKEDTSTEYKETEGDYNSESDNLDDTYYDNDVQINHDNEHYEVEDNADLDESETYNDYDFSIIEDIFNDNGKEKDGMKVKGITQIVNKSSNDNGNNNYKSNKVREANKLKSTLYGSGTTNVNLEEFKRTLNVFAQRGTSLVVTGCGGSGVTTTAFNIANVLNKLGYKVLFVDCDTEFKSGSYMTKECYESMNVTDMNVKTAFNSTDIASNVAIVRKGLHIISDGIASDTYEFEKEIHKGKIGQFVTKAKSNYQFIVFGMNSKLAFDFGFEILMMAEDVIYVADTSQYGLTKMLLQTCNIEDDNMQRFIFQKGKVIYNSLSTLDSLYGHRVKDWKEIPKIMDDYLESLVGEAAGELSFRKMKLVGYIPDIDDNMDKGKFSGGCWSDTEQGMNTFLEILKGIIWE